MRDPSKEPYIRIIAVIYRILNYSAKFMLEKSVMKIYGIIIT